MNADYEKAKQFSLTSIKRWENGVFHHPMSVRLMEFLMAHDLHDYDDYFCWKMGGDGDNGENLMFEMDAFFEMMDLNKKYVEEKSKEFAGTGTQITPLGNTGISIGCMKRDYRDCLDKSMEEWKKHKKTLPKKVLGKQYRSGVYAFAYWLIRWSGLVKPAENDQGQI